MFVAIYTLECIVRLLCYGFQYFKSAFNILDFLIVCVSITDTWFLAHLGQTSNLNMIRVVRLVRLVRIIRLVRLLRFFKELMSAFRALTLSISSVAWMCLLLILFTFVYAMILNLVIEHNLDTNLDSFPAFDDYFGNKVYKTSITLFQIGSGYSCEGFPRVIRPLLQVSIFPSLSFLAIVIYLIIFRYAFLTALVGVFVHSVSENEQLKKEERMELNIANWTRWANDITTFLKTCYLVNENFVCLDDFMIACDHPYVIQRLRFLNLHLYSPILVFNFLDHEKFGKVHIDSISKRLVSIRKGGPSGFALHAISQKMASIRALFNRTRDRFKSIEFDSIRHELVELETEVSLWITTHGSWTQKQRMAGNITRNL